MTKTYGKNEYCKAIECPGYQQEIGSCLLDEDHDCLRTAKEFHRWLNNNGWRIEKEVAYVD